MAEKKNSLIYNIRIIQKFMSCVLFIEEDVEYSLFTRSRNKYFESGESRSSKLKCSIDSVDEKHYLLRVYDLASREYRFNNLDLVDLDTMVMYTMINPIDKKLTHKHLLNKLRTKGTQQNLTRAVRSSQFKNRRRVYYSMDFDVANKEALTQKDISRIAALEKKLDDLGLVPEWTIETRNGWHVLIKDSEHVTKIVVESNLVKWCADIDTTLAYEMPSPLPGTWQNKFKVAFYKGYIKI